MKNSFLIAFLALVWAISTHAEQPNITRLHLAVADELIIPGYEKLAQNTSNLERKAAIFCQNPTQEGLNALRSDFVPAMQAWQSMQHIHFGPIKNLLREYRYQLWPDSRGVINRHLTKLLITRDPAALEAERFANSSIAVQGFSALERLLFEKMPLAEHYFGNEENAYRCQLLYRITANLAQMSRETGHEWGKGSTSLEVFDSKAHREMFATAAQGNDFYEDNDALAGELLKALYVELQLIDTKKLARPLGESLKKARGRRAESWRSQQSLLNIRSNLTAAQKLYLTGFAARIEGSELDQTLRQQFNDVLRTIDSVDTTLHDAVADPEVRPKILHIQAQVNQLEQSIGEYLAKTLQLSIGFNSLDGD